MARSDFRLLENGVGFKFRCMLVVGDCVCWIEMLMIRNIQEFVKLWQ